ncbi:hypothetical protein [Parasphingorhabdus sp.]|uniref:hypothetical protein n=1 Tax=Parasphingorhabdus sp. TaxID=2709688 RepID=UPI003A8DE442
MTFFSWLWPKSSPELPETTEPNLLLKLNSEFDKSKRVLLWHATLTLLVGSATLMNQDSKCFRFAMVSNFSLPPGFLSMLLLVYGLYLWWMFEYHLKRVEARNSPKMHKSEEDRFDIQIKALAGDIEKHRELLNQHGDLNVVENRKNFELVSSKINDLLNSGTKSGSVADFLQIMEKTISDKISNFVENYNGNLSSHRTDRNQMGEQIHQASAEARRCIENHLAEQTSALEQQLQMTLGSLNSSESSAKEAATSLNEVVDVVKKLATSVGSLSNEIRNADIQKFKFSDKFVPRFMAAGTLLLMLGTLASLFSSNSPFWSCSTL